MATATYVPLGTITLGSASTITFSSIPSGYTDLRIVVNDNYVSGGTSGTNSLRINGVSSGIYAHDTIQGQGNASNSQYISNTMTWFETSNGNNLYNSISTIVIDIFQYSNTNMYKSVLSMQSGDANGLSGGAAVGLWIMEGVFKSTSAVTSVTVGIGNSSYNAGASATLWGI
jgi:hypothetical protein